MKLRPTNIAFVFLLAATLAAAGCATEEEAPEVVTDVPAEVEATAPVAVAELAPTEGNDVQGTVRFVPVDGAVRVEADITGLTAGEHGFHVHETGDCSAPDATSAGGHYAPEGSPHGAPDAPAAQRHTGDLGNLVADVSGRADYERVDSILTLDGPESLIGKAVIVHGGADDLTSQPSGDAGPRVACGVIAWEEDAAGPAVDATEGI